MKSGSRVSGFGFQVSGYALRVASYGIRHAQYKETQILENGNKSKTVELIFALSGWVMIGHFVFLFSRCFLRGTLEDIFWISHVGTLIGGLGALFRNRFLISIALVCLLGHHLTWLFDTTFWLVNGKFPIGTTTYLKDASLADWLQSSNHFFTVPSLFLLACWQGGVRKDAWIWSTILFSILLLISYFYLPPTANVNSAHKLWPGLDQSYLSVLEQLPNLGYLFSLIILNSIGNYFPANLLLRVVYHFLKTIGCERSTTSKSRP